MRAMIIPFLLLPALALAQAAPPEESDAGLLERARRLQADADRLRSEADVRYREASRSCHNRFLVNSCLEEAKVTHVHDMQAARRLDLEGKEIEREVKRREIAAKEAQRPLHEAEQRAQGELYRSEEARRAEARAARIADKERQAAENRQKLAEEQAKRERKLEAQKQKEAKAAEKRQRREAKAAERAARQAEKEAAASR